MTGPGAAAREAAHAAAALGRLAAQARRAALTLAPGAHGLRRPGPGETFWQHREHRPEEGPRAVDWRRSARGDRLYARDRERETPAALMIWVDPRPGMAWTGAPGRPTKLERAQVAALALGFAFLRGGERAAALGAPPTTAPERLAVTVLRPGAAADGRFAALNRRHCALIATDGLEPVADADARLAALRGAGAAAMLLVADPAEEDFPYAGRMLFEDPAGAAAPELVGRADSARAAYRAAYQAHRAALIQAAARHGVATVAHRTDQPLAPALLALAAALGARPRA